MTRYILAADVSTLGGIIRLGFNKLGPLVGACLNGSRSKLPLESGGGVAAIQSEREIPKGLGMAYLHQL